MQVIKVKPWGKDQGDFVLIDEVNFNPEFHEHFAIQVADGTLSPAIAGDGSGEALPPIAMTKAEIMAALDAKGIDYKPAMSKAELQALLA